jgi:hypothetical protein
MNEHVKYRCNTDCINNLMFVQCIIRRSRNNQNNAQICTTVLFSGANLGTVSVISTNVLRFTFMFILYIYVL